MVESSLPTFDAFCQHHDPTSLLADQAYMRQYVAVVRQYALLASTRAFPDKLQPSKPIALRWRNSGLEAIRSVASSDALSSVAGRQYDIAVPMILENLWTDNEEFLDILLQRAELEEKVEGNALLKRRASIATVQTADTGGDNPNPIALLGTGADVDKLAEEDIGVLAMHCLKQIFVVPNRSQVHTATAALLKFVEERVSQEEDVVRTNNTGQDSGWAIKMFLLVARWAPVADRFTILITALDTLAKFPLTDDNLRQHIVLAAMIGALLRSDINLIGLSVMDVLLQFLAHIRRLVQLPGDPNSMRSEPGLPGQPDPRSPTTLQFAETSEKASTQRKDLLLRLQECIGDLATHVYYADQISDMILTILQKLKPSRQSTSPANSSPKGENAENTAAGPEEQHLDSLFSLTVAKIAALRAIKSILRVANPRTKMSGNLGLSRNHVPLHVWDGTQWLLRDPDGLVRKAYADAVLTWLDRETTSKDSRARDETVLNGRAAHKNRDAAALARRVVSSAAAVPYQRGDKPAAKVPRSNFLELLHLAIYDNAIQYVDYETDIVLLHVLLVKLASQLGVNAVRYGLPMIFRLQEDIQDADTPIAKVRLGSLVHGYFWIVTERFDFDSSLVGRAIHNEIVRRRTKNFWVEGINVPAPLIEAVGTPGMARSQPRLPLKEIESEALLPFDDRLALVDAVCQGYQERVTAAAAHTSPPQSPAASPGRSFTHPILGHGATFSSSTIPTIETITEMPARFREQMLEDWSREAVLVAVQASSGSKSNSLNGSRTTGTGAGGMRNQLVAAQANGAAPSAAYGGSNANLRPNSSPAAGAGTGQNLGAKLRKTSVRSNASPNPGSITSGTTAGEREHVTSVEQLKLVLSGHLQPPPTTMHGAVGSRGRDSARFPSFKKSKIEEGSSSSSDSSEESMVSYDMTPSELSFNPATGQLVQDEINAATAGAASAGVGGPGTAIAGPSTSAGIGGGAQRRPSTSKGNAGPTSGADVQRERRQLSSGSSSLPGGPLSSNPAQSPPRNGDKRDSKVSNGINVVDHQTEKGSFSPSNRTSAVPPVPPIPSGLGLTFGNTSPITIPPGPASATLPRPSTSKRSLKGRGDHDQRRGVSTSWGSPSSPTTGTALTAGFMEDSNFWASSPPSSSPPVMDLQALLKGIDSNAGESSWGGVSKPPY